MVRLRRVIDALPADFAALRAEASAAGYAMLDTLEREWSSGAARFNRPGEMLAVAYADNVLAGIGGLTQEARSPGALRMQRFYVRAASRRHGVGRALATVLLDGAEGHVVTVNAAPGSEAFWESLGFVAAPRERQTHTLAR
jgi:GNAT superfamily N-acetyltransferase